MLPHVVSTREPLRVFVAMPGTTMGQHAAWNDIEEIKSHLLEPIRSDLEHRLNRPVHLVIEKDKIAQGPIHHSMFEEAILAPVYIADLSGANANVYLELGVRWAVTDRVTVLICQDFAHDVKFNVSANRIIQYGPKPAQLEEARRQIVAAIHTGLTSQRIDSPVREAVPMMALARTTWDALLSEVEKLRAERGDSLVDAAESAPIADQAALLLQAISMNPRHTRAHLALGITLRREGFYQRAADHLRYATELDPNLAPAWRELGIALSKGGDPQEAVVALRQATYLNPNDTEAHSTLGGAYRRLARSSAAGGHLFNWELLRAAKQAYERAVELSGNDTYPMLNAASINLLLSKVDPGTLPDALKRYDDLKLLARFAVADSRRQDPWKLFDLASTQALTGEVSSAIDGVREAMSLVGESERGAMIDSITEPLLAVVHADVLPPDIAQDVVRLVEVCNSPSQLTQPTAAEN